MMRNMKELLMHQEYTGQEIIDWIVANSKHDISIELTRKYYEFDEEWYDIKCNIHQKRKYKIHSYTTYWYDKLLGEYSHQTYKICKVPITKKK